jgi:hypothetical protein
MGAAQDPPTTSQFEQDQIAKNKVARKRLVPYVPPPVVPTDEEDIPDGPPLGYVGKPASSGDAAPWGLPPPVTSVTPGTSKFEQELVAKNMKSRERIVPYVSPPAFGPVSENETADPVQVGYMGKPKSARDDLYSVKTYDAPSTSKFEQEQIAKANAVRENLKPYVPPPASQSSVPRRTSTSPLTLGYLGKAESTGASTRSRTSPPSSPAKTYGTPSTSIFEQEEIAKNNERRERLKPYVPPPAPAPVEEDEDDFRMVGYIGSYVPPPETQGGEKTTVRTPVAPLEEEEEDDDEFHMVGYVGSYVPPPASENTRYTAPPAVPRYEEEEDDEDSPPIGYVGSYVPPPDTNGVQNTATSAAPGDEEPETFFASYEP